jgi:hypothetical protein
VRLALGVLEVAVSGKKSLWGKSNIQKGDLCVKEIFFTTLAQSLSDRRPLENPFSIIFLTGSSTSIRLRLPFRPIPPDPYVMDASLYNAATNRVIGIEGPMKIEIDTRSEDELIELNHRIVARLRFLTQKRAHAHMLEFSIGDRVAFQPEGRSAKGDALKILSW